MDTLRSAESNEKMYAAAADRNKDVILDQLRTIFTSQVEAAGEEGTQHVIEVASGTGQHAAHFAAGIPDIHWIPSEMTSETFASIRDWTAPLPNVAEPVVLDVSGGSSAWQQALTPRNGLMGAYVANMCHISPLSATTGLFEGAASVLRPNGVLCIYGPFTIDRGTFTTESNAAFDMRLRQTNPEWGYRDVEELVEYGKAVGLELERRISMPSNNFLLLFKKLPVNQ